MPQSSPAATLAALTTQEVIVSQATPWRSVTTVKVRDNDTVHLWKLGRVFSVCTFLFGGVRQCDERVQWPPVSLHIALVFCASCLLLVYSLVEY